MTACVSHLSKNERGLEHNTDLIHLSVKVVGWRNFGVIAEILFFMNELEVYFTAKLYIVINNRTSQ